MAADMFVLVIGIALGYHGGSLLNWAFFEYVVGGDEDDE